MPRSNGGRDIRRDIVTAAWELAEKSDTAEFTVKQVAERADVALQTFYRHFASKDELLLAIFEETIAFGMRTYFAESQDAPPVERLRDLVTAPFLAPYDEAQKRGLRWRARERERLREAFPEAVEAVFEPYRTAVVDAIVAACETGEASCDDPELAGTIVMHLVETLVHAAHGGGLDIPPKAVADGVWQLCWHGLAPRVDTGRRRRRVR